MKIIFDSFIDSKHFRFLIGAIVMLTLLGSGLIYFIQIELAKRYRTYSITVKNLPTEIALGSPVNLFGLEVGKVDGVGINEDYDGAVLHLSILEEVSQNLTRDAQLAIVPRLYGTPELNLDPGKNQEPLGKGSTLNIVVEKSVEYLVRESLKSVYEDILPDVTTTVDNFSAFGKQLNNVDLKQIHVLIKSFEKNMMQTSKFIASLNVLQADLKKNFDENINQVNTFFKSMNVLHANLQPIMTKMNTTMNDVMSFTKEINGFTQNILAGEKGLAVSLKRITNGTESLLHNINNISGKTEVLLEGFDRTGANLHVVISNLLEITENLPAIIENVNKMMEQYTTIGSAMQRHWLLRGYVKDIKKEKELKGKDSSQIEKKEEEKSSYIEDDDEDDFFE